ncbi:uncharacterized protein K444DRAFT_279557 [Hyaloscypha bicolor E]|uniref:Uncharacterized protein n=1 Tax=Hyaloscypha bicolor E TaxID=1095630 RepID=A0A2J6SGY7_9HELO|nr:uncharacterized protein K444DRAFT_279557 [Hyaloscypha bicolor E]PMD50028.1 hypothetical protein K444DRAFT_279557 [Hyaloscypha bicolor E]
MRSEGYSNLKQKTWPFSIEPRKSAKLREMGLLKIEYQRGAGHPRDADLLMDHPDGLYFTSRDPLQYTNNPSAMVLNTVSRFKTLVYISSNFISPTDHPRLDISYTLRRNLCHPIRPRNLVTKSTINPYPVRGITTSIIHLLVHNSAVYQPPIPLPANNMLLRIAFPAKPHVHAKASTNRTPDRRSPSQL